MSSPVPKVTVIIAARPESGEPRSARAASDLDYPPSRIEILVARGRNPSAQRNAAADAATGDWLYFLDDDALPLSGNLRQVEPLLHQPDVAVIGGPSLCPPGTRGTQRVLGLVHESFVAFGPSRARYTRIGKLRESGEKELILCNLLVRRSAFRDVGGFDSVMYPNEENVLLDAIRERGDLAFYDPEFVVHRPPRRSIAPFLWMVFRYGRGRGRQVRRHPGSASILNLAPAFFVVYLVALAWQVGSAGLVSVMPLALYALAVLIDAALITVRSRALRALLSPPVIALTTICYGLGLFVGVASPGSAVVLPRESPVSTEVILRPNAPRIEPDPREPGAEKAGAFF